MKKLLTIIIASLVFSCTTKPVYIVYPRIVKNCPGNKYAIEVIKGQFVKDTTPSGISIYIVENEWPDRSPKMKKYSVSATPFEWQFNDSASALNILDSFMIQKRFNDSIDNFHSYDSCK